MLLHGSVFLLSSRDLIAGSRKNRQIMYTTSCFLDTVVKSRYDKLSIFEPCNNVGLTTG
ncbi:MAG: palindromic element RPE4 domain-containing protein [Rickettsia endosymbiont of Glossina mortisans submortisans]|nr:palindromic element RPE4 domain-containing protein [Rickettsia endosymbiont of Glossina mortisans submortisans]